MDATPSASETRAAEPRDQPWAGAAVPALSPKVKEYFALDNAALSWWTTDGHPRYDRQLAIIEAHVPVAGREVLDAGTGRGRFAACYARLGARRVLALDISAGMLAEARERVRAEGAHARVDFRQGDIEGSDFEPGSFDIINCMEVYVHLPDPRAATRRFHRWLRPGGVLVANIDLPGSGAWWFHWVNEPLRTARHVLLGQGREAARYVWYRLLPAGARAVLAPRLGWPETPRVPLRLGAGAQKYRMRTTEETLARLRDNPGLRHSRAEDAICRVPKPAFLDLLTAEGFTLERVVREGHRYQLAYGVMVIATKR